MPINKYYGGHGTQVMTNMVREYGAKKGKQVFYATDNKRKKKLKRNSLYVRSKAKSSLPWSQ